MEITIDGIARMASKGAAGFGILGLLAWTVDWARRGQRGITVVEEPNPAPKPVLTPATIRVGARPARLFPSQERAAWVVPVNWSARCAFVGDHYRRAAELLQASEHEGACEDMRYSMMEEGGFHVRKGVETGVGCVLDMEGVCRQGLDLCSQLRECEAWLPAGLVSRLHEARQVCKRVRPRIPRFRPRTCGVAERIGRPGRAERFPTVPFARFVGHGPVRAILDS